MCAIRGNKVVCPDICAGLIVGRIKGNDSSDDRRIVEGVSRSFNGSDLGEVEGYRPNAWSK